MPALTFSAVLTERRDAGAGLKLVTLTPPPEHAHGYHAPGQYIEVRAGSSGFFVLAGEIGAPSWELLVRKNGGASDALTSAPEGTPFDVVGPLGKGFPLDRAHRQPLVVAVAGSALAVTRPILRERIAHREGPITSVYVGARTAKDVPLATEVAGWVHAGVQVILCLSRPEQDDEHLLPEARRARGYVQSVLSTAVDGGAVREGLIFAAGPAGMLEELRKLPIQAPGRVVVPKLEVITNV